MDKVLDFLLLVLAVDAVIVGWFHGGLEAKIRPYAEAWQTSTSRYKYFLGKVLVCPICLPKYVAVVFCLVAWFVPYGMLPITILAVGGLSTRLLDLWVPMEEK